MSAGRKYMGFKGQALGIPPVVTILTPENDTISCDPKKILSITGTVLSEEGTSVNDVSYEIKVTDSLNKNKALGTISSKERNGSSNGSLKLTEGILGESAFVRFEIDAASGTWYPEEGVSADGRNPSAGDVFKYVISVIGTTGSPGNDVATVQIDKKNPEAKIDVSKLISSVGRNDCVNGDITIQCSLSDNNAVAESRIEITGNTLSAPITEQFGEGDRNPVWTYDTTTNLSDKNEYTITVYVKDTAGNEGNASRRIFVDQDTDRPVIDFTNGTYFPEATDWSNAVNGVNTFGVGSNNKVIFSFSDDDGLKNVTLSVFDKDGSLLPAEKTEKQENREKAENPVVYEFNGSTTGTVSYTLPKVEASYKIAVEAVDIEHEKGTPQNQEYRKTTADNYIVVSDSNFVIELDKKEIQAKDEAVTVTGTLSVTDMAKIAEIHRYKMVRENDTWQKVGEPQSSYKAMPADGQTNSIKVELPSGAEKTKWTDTIDSSYLTEGEDNRFYYEATDTTGHRTFISLICKVDKTPPFIQLKPAAAEWNKSGSQTIEVIAKDEGAFASGISSVKAAYKRNDEDTSGTFVEFSRGAPCDENGSTTAPNEKKLYTLYSTTLTGIPDNPAFKVNITAADAVGNESRLEPSFKIDTTAPQFETPPAITEGLVLKSDKVVEVTYTASDATSGIKTVEFSTDSSMKDEAGFKQSETSASGPFLYGLSHLSGRNGTYTLYVRATDNAGNSTDSMSAGTFIIDEKLPEVKITAPASGSTVNNTISFTGTVIDENYSEMNPVLKYKKQSDGAWTTALDGSFTYSREGQNWTIDGFDTKKLNDSKTISSEVFDFCVTFTDAAGNEGSSEAYRLNIDQHSDRPVIKTTFSNDGGAFRHGEKTFSGSVSDDDGMVQETAIQIVPQGAAIGNWQTLSTGSNEWSAEVPADGIYDIYFKVTDAAGTEFMSGGEPLAAPKISNNNTDTGSTFITVSVDTTPPKIDTVEVTKKQLPSDADAYETVQNNSVFGGAAYRHVRFRINASDIVSQGEKLAVNVTIGEKKYTASYNSSDGFYYTENSIDMSGFTSGIYQFTVTATDEAKRAVSFQRMITIDNDAPDTIKNVVPSAATQVTGEFSMTGLVQDDENANSGIPVSGALWYYIPKESEKGYTSDTNLANLAWTSEKLTQSSVSWSIDFTGLAERLGYSKENEKLGDDYMYANDSSNPDLYRIPVWFKVVDNVGNIGYIQENTLLFNPNADKPTVKITYPVKPDSGSLTMGGTVRIMGIAGDNEGVDAVYLQFDFNNDGTYENGEGIPAAPKNNGGQVYVGGDSSNVAQDIPVKGGRGFKAKGTVSWSSSVDLSQFNAGEKIRIRAVAVDNDTANGRLASAWSAELVIEVDNNTPQIEALKLVQYEDSSYSKQVKEVTYADDIFISGDNWRLEGRAVHRSGIQSVSVSQGNAVLTEDEPIGEAGRKNKRFFIPISVGGVKWSVTVTAVPDVTDSGYNSITTYSVQIDNTPPSLETDGESLVIYRDNYGISANRLGSAVHVQNSNGEYATITARLTESGSGFERSVFYFMRTDKDGGKKRVYNVMEEAGSDRTANRTSVAETKADGSVYINGEGLAVLYKENVGRSDATKIDIVADDNIRKGGLVKIGGAYHRIIEKDSGSITLDANVSETFTSAEFVYGMVVDNSGESRNTDGSLKNDDGDGMVESYTKSGSDYTWDASVPSANIPDGPIEIHVVVFDKAGNASHASVKTRISNSPVRITSVKLATDLNANGSFEPSEENQFFAIKNADGSGNKTVGVDVWTLDTKKELYGDAASAKYWTVKNRLAVTPEFVGGTRPFYCTFSKSETEQLSEAERYEQGASGVISVENNTQFILENERLDTTTCEGKDVVYRFSFWDSTEELTPGTDTSWTVLNAHVKQELTDSVPPTASISPFYWKSSTDNSLYENSIENGHIELEADLNNGSFTGSSGEYDKDPKVSGIIKVQGVANDNTLLKEIKVKIPGFTEENGYMLAGTYTPGSGWTGNGSLEADGWAFAVDTDEITQAGGHTVSWTFTWNSAKISGIAAPDVTIEVQAVDQSSGTSADSRTQTAVGAETPFYRVDVVPYITKLFTGISNTAGEEFARSATGKYIVRSGETVRMYGFNLAPGTNNAEINGMKLETKEGDGTYVSLTVKPEAVSGAVSVTVNGITFLNNRNSNPVFASDTDDTVLKNEYNCRPNRITNNRLTDDVELYIWDMSEPFLNETNITSPMMKMDSESNYYMSYGYQIPSMYVNKNGTTRQIDYSYNKFHNTNVAFDDNGNIYALATNTDRIQDNAAKFVFYTPNSTFVENQMPDSVGNGTTNYKFSTSSKRHLEHVYNDYRKDDDEITVYDINRVKNPKITTCTDGDSTYIAIAYYDYNNSISPVKFRFGRRSGTDISGGIAGGNPNSERIGDSMHESNDPSKNDSSAHGYHIVASSNTSKQGGQYAACGIVPKAGGGYVGVVAWYDAQVRRLCYSYNENPDSPVVGGVWQDNAMYLDSEYTGWHIDMATDSDGGIHIAYYSTAKGDLKYAYLSRYDDKNPTVVTVDSYLSVGTNITVNIRKEGDKQIPYIYYYNASSNQTPNSIKVSWQNDTSVLRDGAINDKFTGAWESMTIPSKNIPVDATVCGGVPTSGIYADTVVLGYMSDRCYEKAVLKK